MNIVQVKWTREIFSEKLESIEINLNVEVLGLKAITNDGDLIELESSDLDKTIDELAGNVLEINNELSKDKLWETQRILKEQMVTI